ncbi:MAG: hypothetical protein HY397_01850 [Candidatus Doudnabacteria bacterium]|nr:hypothetical protein [Candidatus Doudnabacteria bacterium]
MKRNRFALSSSISAVLPRDPGFKLSETQLKVLRTASKVALALVALAGTVAISVVAPNLFQVFGALYEKRGKSQSFSTKEKKQKITQTFYYLKRSGLIRFKPDGNDWILCLTDLGKKRFSKLSLDLLSVPKAKHWNGRWWLVAADIPTKSHRPGADLLRNKLRQMGFYSLQRTIWLHPFDPRKEIEYITRAFEINNFVTVMEVARIDREDEQKIKSHFKQSRVL